MKECKIGTEGSLNRMICQAKGNGFCYVEDHYKKEDVLKDAQRNPQEALNESNRHLSDLERCRGCLRFNQIVSSEQAKAEEIKRMIK